MTTPRQQRFPWEVILAIAIMIGGIYLATHQKQLGAAEIITNPDKTWVISITQEGEEDEWSLKQKLVQWHRDHRDFDGHIVPIVRDGKTREFLILPRQD